MIEDAKPQLAIQAGTAEIPKGAASVVVGGFSVTPDSIITVSMMSRDEAACSVAAVASEGSLTIYPDVPPAAAAKVGFTIINTN